MRDRARDTERQGHTERRRDRDRVGGGVERKNLDTMIERVSQKRRGREKELRYND